VFSDRLPVTHNASAKKKIKRYRLKMSHKIRRSVIKTTLALRFKGIIHQMGAKGGREVIARELRPA
jgi:hypothetical protein